MRKLFVQIGYNGAPQEIDDGSERLLKYLARLEGLRITQLRYPDTYVLCLSRQPLTTQDRQAIEQWATMTYATH